MKAKNQALNVHLLWVFFKHYLFSLSLGTRLNLRPPVEPGTFIVRLHPGQLSFLLQAVSDTLPTAIRGISGDTGIYSAVRNVSYCMWYLISHHCPRIKCLCNWSPPDRYTLLAWLGSYFSFWSPALWEFLLFYCLSMIFTSSLLLFELIHAVLITLNKLDLASKTNFSTIKYYQN